jgi:hypothetical protein
VYSMYLLLYCMYLQALYQFTKYSTVHYHTDINQFEKNARVLVTGKSGYCKGLITGKDWLLERVGYLKGLVKGKSCLQEKRVGY